MSVSIEVRGLGDLLQNFRGIGKDYRKGLVRGTEKAAQALQREIVDSIRQPGTGRVYTHHFFQRGGKLLRGRRRDKPHQASSKGEAPATDQGGLIGSVRFEPVRRGYRVKAGGRGERGYVRYAKWLEHGTTKMAARPYMAPGYRNALPKMRALIRKELANVR